MWAGGSEWCREDGRGRGWQGAKPRLLAQHRTLRASVSSSAEWEKDPPPPQLLTTQLCRWSDPASLPGAARHPHTHQRDCAGGLLAKRSRLGPDARPRAQTSLASPAPSPPPRHAADVPPPHQSQGGEPVGRITSLRWPVHMKMTAWQKQEGKL